MAVLARVDRAPGDGDDDSDALRGKFAWAREIERKYPSRQGFQRWSGARDASGEIKTPYEQSVLRRSVEISADAHVEGMRAARPGRWEYEVESAIEATFMRNGALSWGYPSIVGSGPNATILHYLSSTQADAGWRPAARGCGRKFPGADGRHHPDVSGEWPIHGGPARHLRHRPSGPGGRHRGRAPGREGRRHRSGGARRDRRRSCRRSASSRRHQAPSATRRSTCGFRTDRCTASGWTFTIRWASLDPGAAFVIEPGIYIRPDALDRYPKSSANPALVKQLTPLIERYRYIGVRVEDSFLMTPSGPEMLSGRAPRRIADIERVVGTAR